MHNIQSAKNAAELRTQTTYLEDNLFEYIVSEVIH